MNYHQKKLIGGLVRVIGVIVFAYNFGPYWYEPIKYWLREHLSDFMGKENGMFFAALISCVLAIIPVVIFIKGAYKVLTFNVYLDVFEGKNTSGHEYIGLAPSDREKAKLSAIEKTLEYRNAKMKYMDNESAAKFYMETSSLNNLSNGNSRVSNYINSKISYLDNDSAINFLKNK